MHIYLIVVVNTICKNFLLSQYNTPLLTPPLVKLIKALILILDGSSEWLRTCKVKSVIWYVWKHLFGSTAVANLKLFFYKYLVLSHLCAMCSELPSSKKSMIKAAWGVTNRKYIWSKGKKGPGISVSLLEV